MALDDTTIPPGLTLDEEREACRATAAKKAAKTVTKEKGRHSAAGQGSKTARGLRAVGKKRLSGAALTLADSTACLAGGGLSRGSPPETGGCSVRCTVWYVCQEAIRELRPTPEKYHLTSGSDWRYAPRTTRLYRKTSEMADAVELLIPMTLARGAQLDARVRQSADQNGVGPNAHPPSCR